MASVCPLHPSQLACFAKHDRQDDRWHCVYCRAEGDVLRNHDNTVRFVRDDEPMFPDNPVAHMK